MAKIKRGDQVVVIAGKDKKKTGRVLEVDARSGYVLVEGIARVKRHTKVSQTQRGTKTGGVETVESPIHISNVMLVDPGDKKDRTRVGYRSEEVTRDGKTKTVRTRIARKSGKDI